MDHHPFFCGKLNLRIAKYFANVKDKVMLNKYLLSTALISSILMSASASYAATFVNFRNDPGIMRLDADASDNDVEEEQNLPTVMPNNDVNQGMLTFSPESSDLTTIVWGGFSVETELNLDVTNYVGIVLTDLPSYITGPVTFEMFSAENVFAYATEVPLSSSNEFSISFGEMIGFDNLNKVDVDQIKLTFNDSSLPPLAEAEVPEPTTVLAIISVGGLGFLFRRR